MVDVVDGRGRAVTQSGYYGFGATWFDDRTGPTIVDIDGDTRIPDAERRVAVIPLTSPAPVDYRCLSYSAGINVRVTATAAVGAPMPIACCSHRR